MPTIPFSKFTAKPLELSGADAKKVNAALTEILKAYLLSKALLLREEIIHMNEMINEN